MSDWINWDGGDCPIPGDFIGKAYVMFRSGRVSTGNVRSCRWKHDGGYGDIVYYRLVGAYAPVEEAADQPEYTGGSVSYYTVQIEKPTNPEALPYVAECNDIIEALGMNYAEGNAFKAIWRSCAARNLGKSKAGYKDGLYDAEKVVFFGKRMVEQAK